MLSYGNDIEKRWKRLALMQLELLTGRRKMDRLYRQAVTRWETGADVWETAISMLDLRVRCRGESLQSIPPSGPLVVVANHPFGIVDGLTICQLVSQVRPDFRILINRVLEQVEQIRPYLLPIDFRESKEAMEINLRSRAEALSFGRAGGCVIVFPSGGVSTSTKLWGPAIDAEWKPFTAKLITSAQANVVPIHFAGQNSRAFQIVSQFSLILRLSLLIREALRQMGREISVTIGRTLPFEELAQYPDRAALMTFLREQTYGLPAAVVPHPIVPAALRELGLLEENVFRDDDQ